MGRKFNFIIFGATGFTGKYLIEEMIKTTSISKGAGNGTDNPTPESFTWAIAGRSKAKLDDSLREVIDTKGLKNEIDATNVEKIEADVSNEESIKSMVKQCDVVLNCVGPYLLYGEVVVKACVEEGTHYIDVCYEPPFFKLMNLKYKELAEANGSFIISSCGYASIPADYGSMFLEKKFEGTVNSIESYITLVSIDCDVVPRMSYGTFSSGVNASHIELKFKKHHQEQKDNDYRYEHQIDSRYLKFCPEINAWAIRLPSPFDMDQVMMDCSQSCKLKTGTKPSQTQAFYEVPNLFVALLFLVVFTLLSVVPKWRLGKYLLLKFPNAFMLGTVAAAHVHDNMEAKFRCTVVLKGWDKNTSMNCGRSSVPPNKTSVLKIDYTNAYHVSAKMMLESGIILLTEKNKLPIRGGVYSPGFVFAETTLAERLEKRGVIFAVMDGRMEESKKFK